MVVSPLGISWQCISCEFGIANDKSESLEKGLEKRIEELERIVKELVKLRSIYLCPICHGTGNVDRSLYTRFPFSTGEIDYVMCRSCGGRGIVVI